MRTQGPEMPSQEPGEPGRFGSRPRSPSLLIVTSILVVVLASLMITPFVLDQLARLGGPDWNLRSDVGQAYGGIAAVLGTLALVGVSVSLILQARDSALSREHTHRHFHNELVLKAIEDPELMASWGDHGYQNLDGTRKHFYTNLIVSFWGTMYSLGRLPDLELRQAAFAMFSGSVGRRYWAEAAPLRRSIAVTKRERRFVAILDEEHERAGRAFTAPQPAVADAESGSRPPTADLRRHPPHGAWLVATLSAVGVIGTTVRIRRRRRCGGA